MPFGGGRLSTRDDQSGGLLLGFVAGAACASIGWYAVVVSSLRRPRDQHSDDQDEQRNDSNDFFWWTNKTKHYAAHNDSSSRIGEFPGTPRQRRTRWPWDRKQNRSDTPSSNGEVTPNDNSKHGSSTESPLSSMSSLNGTSSPDHHKKSDFCIGSIFGLDVGGTLAKLVYFEQKPEQVTLDCTDHRRERWYRHSASARAVLLARRGNDGDDDAAVGGAVSNGGGATMRRQRSSSMTGKGTLQHSQASNDDLQTMSQLRQESVPDNLAAYAQSTSMFGFYTTESMDHMHKHEQQWKANGFMNGFANTASNDDLPSSANTMRKVKSMLDLNKTSSQNYNEALDRFYNFARRIDSYREGVKDHKLSFYSRKLGGEFHFIRFETKRMTNAMDLIRANQLHLNIREMGATGGGAHKYANLWKDELGIDIAKQDEMDSLVAGMQFVLATVVGECYTFKPPYQKLPNAVPRSTSKLSLDDDFIIEGVPLYDDDSPPKTPGTPRNGNNDDVGKGDEWWLSKKVQRDSISQASAYPYLLVSIGTGVSILRVDGPRKHVRVSGSTIGGGTYWGLVRLLTDIEDFETVIRLAERGDPSKIDLMIGDIYGNKPEVLQKMGLAPDLVASSFGKLIAKDDPASGLKEEDIARALLLMITINIGQVAYLNAQLHKTSRIYFVGNFLRSNSISQKRLSYAIDYWSKGDMEALFLEHEGYFGALGAFLLSQNIPHDLNPRMVYQESLPACMDHLDSERREGQNPPLHKRSHTFESL